MAIELQTIPSSSDDKKVKPSLLSEFSGWGKTKVKQKDRLLFTERLALMLETGTSLYGSLQAIEGQLENKEMIRVVSEIREDITGGAPFSHALAQHPGVFSSTYVNLIAASEQGGFMADVLKQLIEMEEKQSELRATLISSLSYPVFLIIFSIGVVVFVLAVVFPKFAEIFASISDQLPVTTIALMWASDVLRQYWAALIIAFVVILFLTLRWIRSDTGRHYIDHLKLTVPVIRVIFIELYITQLMRVMGLSLKYGVSLPDAIQASRDVVANTVFRELIHDIENQIQEGRGISSGFQKAEFIPDLVKQMIATGEESGKLSLVMARIADFYQRELSRRVERLSKMVEPVMLLVMGAVVGVIVSSLILPIFKLAHTVQ